MGKKSKLTLEQWQELFTRYLAGESRRKLASEYGVSTNTITQWSYRYQKYGLNTFSKRFTNQTYTSEFKLNVVQEYLRGGISQFDLALKYDLPSKAPIQRWIKEYNSHMGNLKTYNGGKLHMTKGRKTTLEERIEIVGHCIEHNRNYKGTAETYKVSYNQVYAWVHKYEKSGIPGLKDTRGRGKDSRDMNELERVKAELKILQAQNRRLQMENDVLKKTEEIERGLILAKSDKKHNTKR